MNKSIGEKMNLGREFGKKYIKVRLALIQGGIDAFYVEVIISVELALYEIKENYGIFLERL